MSGAYSMTGMPSSLVRTMAWLAAPAAAALLWACSSAFGQSPVAGGGPPLRSPMEARGRWIGSAVAVKPLVGDSSYGAILSAQFDIVTPENAMKFAIVHPRAGSGPESYDFSQADTIVSFAAAHGMKVRGHTLVWHNQIPAWVTSGNHSSNDLAAILRDHIQTVVGHFKGKVYSWDVVNEAVNPDGTLRQTLWSTIGPGYIADAFRWARAVDPGAKLFYNDYGAEASQAKADAIFNLVRSLRSQGAPVDGLGLQFHMTTAKSYGDLTALLHRFAGLGVEVHITEIDVNTGSPETDDQQRIQADLFGRAMSACLAEPACKAYVMWGFSDKYSWRADQSPLIYDASMNPKPACRILRRILLGADLDPGTARAP